MSGRASIAARLPRRAMLLVIAIGALIALALLAGALDHRPLPMDPGTPAEVTTIGGQR